MQENNYNHLDGFLSLIKNIHDELPTDFEITKKSLLEFYHLFPSYADGKRMPAFSHFKNWWGRGQQYISFIKRSEF